jgi:hypothetical protein
MEARFSDFPAVIAFITLVVCMGALLMAMAGFGNSEDMRNVFLYSAGACIPSALIASAISFSRRG